MLWLLFVLNCLKLALKVQTQVATIDSVISLMYSMLKNMPLKQYCSDVVCLGGVIIILNCFSSPCVNKLRI